MSALRFVDPEPVPGTDTVVRVWDTAFDLPRASRILTQVPEAGWDAVRERVRTLSRVRHRALPPLVAIGDEFLNFLIT